METRIVRACFQRVVKMKKINIATQVLTNCSSKSNQLLLPPSMGKGYIKSVRLKSEIQLIIMDYVPKCPITIEYTPPFPTIGFGFRLSGRSQVHSTGQKKSNDIRPGHAGFNCCTDLVDLTETIDVERVVHVNILMDWERFSAFAEGETQGLPPQLEKLPNGKFCHNGCITPAMRTTISHIFNCPYHGWAKTFFLESKALELAAHKIGQIEAVDRRKPGSCHLPAPDMDRIREAARMLAGDLETSPDLNQLSRSVGMCRSKLHRCFRMVYGITPFEYLRNRRLEAAMDFLMDGQMNVTQAAYAVGYSSPSYFTKAFKKYFGHLPSEKFH